MTDPFLTDASAIAMPNKSAGLRILVADDDRTLREGCASVLQMDGHSVVTAGRGEEAIDLVRRRKFDVILVDLYMAPISGMEVLKTALEAHKDTIVVMMTGNPSVASSIEALRAGAWDYLPKPFSASHLQVLVGRAAHAVAAGKDLREQIKPSLVTQNGAGEPMALLGVSPSFKKAVELAQKVAATDASTSQSSAILKKMGRWWPF
jgi:DNA-binding NtrC family response regulator